MSELYLGCLLKLHKVNSKSFYKDLLKTYIDSKEVGVSKLSNVVALAFGGSPVVEMVLY